MKSDFTEGMIPNADSLFRGMSQNGITTSAIS